MRKRTLLGGLLTIALVGLPVAAWSHMKASDLPAGPIRDRHHLMEGIGAHAKKIGQALKAGKTHAIAPEAEGISAAAKQIPDLFPPGSTNPKSRAKPEIWTNWDKFVGLANDLSSNAAALATAAKAGGEVKPAADKMFGTCKSCHDDFRVPEKDG